MKRIPPAVMKTAAASVAEVAGLLKMIGPLAKRCTALTEAEQDILEDVIHKAGRILGTASMSIYAAKYPPADPRETAVSQRAKP